MSTPYIAHISEEETQNTYTTEKTRVGQLAMVEDGRLFRFTENGGVATVCSEMQQARLEVVANALAQAVGTMAAGVTVLTGVGASNASFAVNILKGGYVFSPTSADLNPVYRIKSNTLITLGAETGTITLWTPTVAAIGVNSTISYIRSLWRDTIVAVSTTPTAMVLGVAVNATPVDNFGWIQSRGVASVLFSDTPVIGDPLGPGTAPGAAREFAAGSAEVNPVYGICVVAAANTVTGLAFLTID